MSGQYYLTNTAPEWERLEEMHKGIDAYLGHKLSLGPAIQNVKKILELGCGSGAWAIQAARTYPEATVIAVDQSPLPPRPLPSNMQFRQLDVTYKLPFESGSFDIVHARLLFMHLPNWKKVLENVTSLLKPGGWLWIEEVDGRFYDNSAQGLGLSLKAFNMALLAHSRLSNVDVLAASSLDSVLKGSKSLSDVHSLEIKCPINGKHSGDPNAAFLGQVIWKYFRRIFKNSEVLCQWFGNVITSKMTEQIIQEVEDPSRSVYIQIKMTWSQKK